jgi:hypothetical protein
MKKDLYSRRCEGGIYPISEVLNQFRTQFPPPPYLRNIWKNFEDHGIGHIPQETTPINRNYHLRRLI